MRTTAAMPNDRLFRFERDSFVLIGSIFPPTLRRDDCVSVRWRTYEFQQWRSGGGQYSRTRITINVNFSMKRGKSRKKTELGNLGGYCTNLIGITEKVNSGMPIPRSRMPWRDPLLRTAAFLRLFHYGRKVYCNSNRIDLARAAAVSASAVRPRRFKTKA
jgi:hypothetical protein